MRIFLAGASGDRHLIRPLIESLPSFGCTGYNWTNAEGYDHPSLHNPLITAGQSDAEIKIAEALILHVSEKPSPGAVGEAFLAHAAGLPIVLLVQVPGTIYGEECYAQSLKDTIPPENIWAHWFAAQYPVVGTLEEALSILGGLVVFPGAVVL